MVDKSTNSTPSSTSSTPKASSHAIPKTDSTPTSRHTSPALQPYRASLDSTYTHDIGSTTYPISDSRRGSVEPEDIHEPELRPESTSSPLPTWVSPVGPIRPISTPFGSPVYQPPSPSDLNLDAEGRHTPPIPEIRLIDPTPVTTIATSTAPSTIRFIPWRDTLEIPSEEVSRNAKRRRITEVEVDIPPSLSDSNMIMERNEMKRWKWVVRELHDMCLRGAPGTSEGVFRVEHNGTCTILRPVRGEIGLRREEALELMDLVESLDRDAIAQQAATSNQMASTSTRKGKERERPLLYEPEPTPPKNEKKQELTDAEKARQVGIAKYVIRVSPFTENRALISRRVIELLHSNGSTLEPALVRLAKFLVHQALQDPERVAAVSPPSNALSETTTTAAAVMEVDPTPTTEDSDPVSALTAPSASEPVSTQTTELPDDIIDLTASSPLEPDSTPTTEFPDASATPNTSSIAEPDSTLTIELQEASAAPTAFSAAEPGPTLSTQPLKTVNATAAWSRSKTLVMFLLIYRNLSGTRPTKQEFYQTLAAALRLRGASQNQIAEASTDAKPYVDGHEGLSSQIRDAFASADRSRNSRFDQGERIRHRRLLHDRWRNFQIDPSSVAISPEDLSPKALSPKELDRRLLDALLIDGADHALATQRLKEFWTDLRTIGRTQGRYGSMSALLRRHVGYIGRPEDCETHSIPLSLDDLESSTASSSSSSSVSTPTLPPNTGTRSSPLLQHPDLPPNPGTRSSPPPQHPPTSTTAGSSSRREAPKSPSPRRSPNRQAPNSVWRKLPSALPDVHLAPLPSNVRSPEVARTIWGLPNSFTHHSLPDRHSLQPDPKPIRRKIQRKNPSDPVDLQVAAYFARSRVQEGSPATTATHHGDSPNCKLPAPTETSNTLIPDDVRVTAEDSGADPPKSTPRKRRPKATTVPIRASSSSTTPTGPSTASHSPDMDVASRNLGVAPPKLTPERGRVPVQSSASSGDIRDPSPSEPSNPPGRDPHVAAVISSIYRPNPYLPPPRPPTAPDVMLIPLGMFSKPRQRPDPNVLLDMTIGSHFYVRPGSSSIYPPGHVLTARPPIPAATSSIYPPGHVQTARPPIQAARPPIPAATSSVYPPGHIQTARPPIQTARPLNPAATSSICPPGHIRTARPPIQTACPPNQMIRSPIQTVRPAGQSVRPSGQTVHHPMTTMTTSPTSPRSISNPIPTAIVPAKRPRRLSDVGEPPLPTYLDPNIGFESESPSGPTIQPRSVDDQDMLNRIQLGQYQFPPARDQSNNP